MGCKPWRHAVVPHQLNTRCRLPGYINTLTWLRPLEPGPAGIASALRAASRLVSTKEDFHVGVTCNTHMVVVHSPTNQADLNRVRQDQTGVCWWCGGVADSREHRHKASLLRRMWSDEGLLLGREGQDFYPLPSWRSDAVKFGKVLCANCNNVRSQPFDEAYDVYAEFVHSNTARLSRARSIDWRDIYGANWEQSTRLLGCYAVKNFGCWIAENGFPPPRVFAAFLDGGDLVDTRLMLTRQQSVSLAVRASRLSGGPPLDRGIGVLPAAGWLDAERTRLTAYEGYSYISDICMRLNWADASGKGELFWTEPTTPLATMPASISQRALAIRFGVRSLARRALDPVRRKREQRR